MFWLNHVQSFVLFPFDSFSFTIQITFFQLVFLETEGKDSIWPQTNTKKPNLP